MATAHIAPAADAQPVASDADKAVAEVAAAAEHAKKAPQARYIQYVGALKAATKAVSRPSGAAGKSIASRIGANSHVATISPEQWEKQGIAAKEVTQWDFEHDWRVNTAKLSAEQIDWLLNEDHKYTGGVRFELVDGHGNKVDD